MINNCVLVYYLIVHIIAPFLDLCKTIDIHLFNIMLFLSYVEQIKKHSKVIKKGF